MLLVAKTYSKNRQHCVTGLYFSYLIEVFENKVLFFFGFEYAANMLPRESKTVIALKTWVRNSLGISFLSVLNPVRSQYFSLMQRLARCILQSSDHAIRSQRSVWSVTANILLLNISAGNQFYHTALLVNRAIKKCSLLELLQLLRMSFSINF